ncbi:MAG: peroxiredoxin [Alphaproteobacteria bacterium]
MADLNEGDAAPDFTLPTDQGEVSLSALRGEPVVLYFYPKDDTTGCTVEAQDFTARLAAFAKAGATVIGVSRDSPKSHARFRAKYELAHVLASDEDTAVMGKYGVWVEKSMYGRKYMGASRDTFLIDAKGIIRQIWRKAKVSGHSQDVLAALKAMT